MNLFYACGLTLLLEVPLFVLAGYRRWEQILLTVCANTVTNLALNLTLAALFPAGSAAAVAVGEILVTAAEYGIYAAAFGGSGRLALLTAAANLLSFGAGTAVALL